MWDEGIGPRLERRDCGRHSRGSGRSFRLVWMALAAILGACAGQARAQSDAGAAAEPVAETLEYPVKAAYVYKFAHFVEWPGTGGTASPLLIGVLGDDLFGGALDRAVAWKTVGGRRLVVRRFRNPEELEECAIVFVAGSATGLDAILSKTARWPSLTVGESEGFTQAGGMIRFFVDDNRVRFEVNLPAAESAGLRLSSRLLTLARVTGVAGRGAR